MNLLQRFTDFIQNENLFHQKDKLLLAVSGGVDSVVLCELCKQAGFNFAIAHCNFKLRGDESESDKVFVNELAEKYEVEFFVKDFETETYAQSKKISIQLAARELRYEWFYQLIDNKQFAISNNEIKAADSPLPIANWIITAHHLDDNIETLLMNFFKGTGVAGLRGMLPRQGKIVRPLLFVKKDELIGFAKANNLQWVEDSSNLEDKYSRNYFRHQIIPLVQKIYPEAESNLADNLKRFRDIEQLYHQAIDRHKKKLMEFKGNEVHIPVLKLKKSTPLHSVIYEIIKDFGFSPQQVSEVEGLMESETGKYVRSSTHRIIKNRNWLIIAANQNEKSETFLIEEGYNNWQLAIGNWQLEYLKIADFRLSTSNFIADLDAALIRFPLILRRWKTGDYFYPLGMRKKKKLSRFLIDQKLSKTEKENVWVLEMDKKIIWVVGMRIDDRFKVGNAVSSILRISLKPS